MHLRSVLLPIAAWAALAAVAPASAQDVFKCVDDKGNVTFANTGNTKGCSRMNVEPVVIPKFVAPKGSTTASPSQSPSGFPRVDSATQKERDNDRRRILEDELRDKETRLAELKREYNNGEPERLGNERNYQKYLDRKAQLESDIGRAQSDVNSIKGELGRIQ